VFNIPTVNGIAAGVISVLAGSNRTITIRAYDAGGVETHTGSVTLNIQPQTNPAISIVLTPLTGNLPITVTLGSFSVTVGPAAAALTPGDTVTLTATVLDASGNPVTGQVAWATLASRVAIVVSSGQQTGRVTAVGPGLATVVAMYGGIAGPAAITVTPRPASGPLRVLATNPRYFTDGSGRAIVLAGSHTWANLQDLKDATPSPFDVTGYLSFMQAHNFNFMRLWTWWFPHGGPNEVPCCDSVPGPYPWVRTGPGTANDGGPQFDFTQLDQTYFDRLRARVSQAGLSGIYVSVMLVNGYEFQFDTNTKDGNPFEGGNNVNGITCPGTCPTDNSQIPAQAWTYEQQYLAKVIDAVNDLNNVLYEVSNEAGSPYSDSWQASVISYVKQYEATKPKQHPVGMTFQYLMGSDATLYNSQADWVSPGTTLPPEATGTKVVINDTDHSYYWVAMQADGASRNITWAWENFTRGNNLAFMDPYLTPWPGRNNPTGGRVDPQWNPIRLALQDARLYGEKVDLAHMTPQSALSTSGYCLANPGSQYLVFNPSAGQSFTVTTLPGTYTYEWFDPATHALVQTGSVTVGPGPTFTAPLSGVSVLWLHK
jgi:hypothetical protein